MAGKSTKITAIIQAKVEGEEAVGDLATLIGKIPDETDTLVDVRVTGSEELSGLATDIAGLPSSTDTRIDAKVTGEQLVSELDADLARLPASVRTMVQAVVKGDAQVDELRRDMASLDESKNVRISAMVKGDAQVDELRRDMMSLDETKDIRISAKVKGDAQVDELRRDMAALDETKDVRISAKVKGDQQVDELRRDMAALDETKNVQVNAQVKGGPDVDQLRRDMAALDEAKKVLVQVRVTGDELIGMLDTDLDKLPHQHDLDVWVQTHNEDELQKMDALMRGMVKKQTARLEMQVENADEVRELKRWLDSLPEVERVQVIADIKGGGARSIKGFRGELESTRERAREARAETGALGSEISGTLGGQFSDGIGYVGDFAEQFRNLKAQAKNAGGGLKAFGAGAAGIIATVAGGFLLDTIISSFQKAAEVSKAFKDAAGAGLPELTQQYYDYGSAVDDATKRARIFALSQNAVFVQLVQSGADWSTTMDAFYKGDAMSWSKTLAQVGQNVGNLSLEQLQATNAAAAAGGALVTQAADAEAAGNKINDYATAQGLARKEAEKTTGSTEDSAVEFANLAKGVAKTRGEFEATAGAGYTMTQVEVDEWLKAQEQGMIDQAAAAAESALETDKMNVAIADVEEVASDAAQQLKYFQKAIDKVTGRSKPLEEATADVNASLLDLTKTAKELKKKDGLGISASNVKGLKTWNVALLTADESGQEIYKTMVASADAVTAHTAAVYSNTAATKGTAAAEKAARAAAEASRATFVKNAQAYGLTKKEAEKLADELGVLAGKKIPNKTFKVLADDQLAKQALKNIKDTKLREKIQKIVGDKTAADRTFRALGDKKILDKVQKVLGNTQPAKDKIKALEAMGIDPKTAKILAYTDPKTLAQAVSHIENAADGTYTAWITVKATIDSTLNKILGIVGLHAAGTSVAPPPGGTAPSSASAGLTTTRVPMRVVSASAAATVTAPIVINISGAMDPVGTARQVRRLINGDQRRTGPANLTISRTPV